jgi:hypothetical protein
LVPKLVPKSKVVPKLINVVPKVIIMPAGGVQTAYSSAALVVREYKGQPYYEAKFRYGGEQVKRRVGRAWLTRSGDGSWTRRRGRVAPGFLDERAAHVRAAELVNAYAAEAAEGARLQREREEAGITFRELASGYLRWLERVKGAKPATLLDHRFLLAEPGMAHRRGNGRALGQIMAALGDKTGSNHYRRRRPTVARRGRRSRRSAAYC